jgi:hypothetical protein
MKHYVSITQDNQQMFCDELTQFVCVMLIELTYTHTHTNT